MSDKPDKPGKPLAWSNRKRFSYLALAATFLVCIAVLTMIASKRIPLGEGWMQLDQTLTKGLLYLASVCLMVLAFTLCAAAFAMHRFRRWEVLVASGSWGMALVAYYVIYVWWPTPELLVIAASENDFLRVKRCLRFDVDINAIAPRSLHRAAERRTALTAAVRQNHGAMVDFLLERGADPNRRDGSGYSPFGSTMSLELGDRLLRAGANINAKDANGLTPLDSLTIWPDEMMMCPDYDERQSRVRALVSRGAEITDLARVKAMDHSDLRLAVLLENLRREKSLPDTNPVLAYLSALLLADEDSAIKIFREHPEWTSLRLRSLMGKGHLPPEIDTLRIAVRFGHVRALKEWILAEQSSGSSLKKPHLGIEVNLAATHGHVEVLKLLKEFGADIAIGPLYCAARHNQLKAAEWLIEQKVEVDACREPELGDTPLAAAIGAEHLKMVELLLDHGASIDMPYYHDNTLLDLACERNQPEVAKLLIARGAKPRRDSHYQPWARKVLEDAGFRTRL